MGNCLSTCTKSCSSPEVQNDGLEKHDLVILAAKHEITSDIKPQLEIHDKQITKVHDLVQRELAALQEQISQSQAVLASLKSDFHEDVAPEMKQEICKIHRTTQTLQQEAQPKSLECVSSTTNTADWHQITSSCPAIVNTAVQTDEDENSPNQNLDFFLPPISPPDSQNKDCKDIPNKSYDSRGSRDIDLDIYRSCRKLSVLPEEEVTGEEIPLSPHTNINRLAPSQYPHHQTHSFESYLLPVPPEEESQQTGSVKRQLSDPTPSPDIHPISRRSSRSTCRPLQIRQLTKEDASKTSENYFRFPDVKTKQTVIYEVHETPSTCETDKMKSEGNNDLNSTSKIDLEFEKTEPEDDNYCPRITSPTYGILQNTVTQLITISDASFEVPLDHISPNGTHNLSVPTCNLSNSADRTPFKTPPESSIVSTPGFYTPQSVSSEFKKSPDSSSNTSSAFQTPLNISPDGTNDNSNKSLTTTSYKTALDTLTNSNQSSIFGTPSSKAKTCVQNNIISDELSMYVTDLDINSQNNLYVKPINNAFDRNRTMLSILIDSPRDQTGDNIPTVHSTLTNLPSTSDEVKKQAINSSETSHTSETISSATALSPDSATLSRGPSRRRLQRSLVRISSQTPLELVNLSEPPVGQVLPTTVEVPLVKDVPVSGIVCSSDAISPLPPSPAMSVQEEEGLTLRRTTSDIGVLGAHGTPLISSHSFPSLSDQVLRQLGLWMEEANVEKIDVQNSEQEIENTFTSLIIAFKTDKLTITSRLELQNRLRDQAENNMANEVQRLKADIHKLSPLCIDSEKMELLEKIVEQVDAMQKSTIRVSSSAEMYGAVQQENRLSKAVDVILRHVDNLKQAYDKERTEHDDTRRLLTENKLPVAVLKLNQSTKRRASIATVPRSQTSSETTKSMSSPADMKGGRSRLNSLPRRISNIISEAEHDDKDLAIEEQSIENKETREQKDIQKTQANSTASLTSLRPSIRKPSGIIEDPSHGAESESEEEHAHEKQLKERMSISKTDSKLFFFNQRYVSSRRNSLKCSWMTKLTSHLHWIQPVDQLLLQLRYGIAVMLLVAAVGVFSSAFFLPNNR